MGGTCWGSPLKVTDEELNNPYEDLSREMAAPIVIPAAARHTATVIFMHGLGDTGHGWSPAFQQIKAKHIKYICPTAPIIPVTLNMGMRMPSWFDIRGLSTDSEQDIAGIKSAAKTVQSWIEEEQTKHNIASNRIIIGGFSQGGALALYSAFTYDKPLAGILALSAWLPLHDEFPGVLHAANREVPILQCHGDADQLVLPQVGQITAQYLKAFDSKHTFKMYPNMGHSACDEEIRDMKAFITQHLPEI